MKHPISITGERLPTRVVCIAVLLLVSGCCQLHSTAFRKASNPRVCPVCVAATPAECNCFPRGGTGYNETHWSNLASPDLVGGMIILDGAVLPAPLGNVRTGASAGHVAEAGSSAAEAGELELVQLVELAELAELVQLAESVEPSELADYCLDPSDPSSPPLDISGAFSVPPVVVAPLPGGDHD